MSVKTYYWDKKKFFLGETYLRRFSNKITNAKFRIGNAGDIFTKEIILKYYNDRPKIIENEGGRLLFTGSILSKSKAGDFLCGIGAKSENININHPLNIISLRGPLTYELLKKKGFNMSNIKSCLDPGLLLKFFTPKKFFNTSQKNIGIIPHYRERENIRYKNLPNNFEVIDIDNHPIYIAKRILKKELIVSSSLHGLIFAHSLNKPVIFTSPLTEEPIFKYKDYFLSINKKYSKPLPFEYKKIGKIKEIMPPKINQEDIFIPNSEYLKENNLFT